MIGRLRNYVKVVGFDQCKKLWIRGSWGEVQGIGGEKKNIIKKQKL